MKEGLNLTDAQQKIQNQIDDIKKKIVVIQPSIKKESEDVLKDKSLIKQYTDELKVLNDKLANVISTQKSIYDVIKGQIADKKKEIETCNLVNKPTSIKNDITANQTESETQGKINKIKQEIGKVMAEITPYKQKTDFLKSDIIALERDIKKIKDEIIQLNKNKLENIKKTEELNTIITGLDKTIFELETKIYGNIVVNNQNLLNSSEKTDASLNYLFSFLNSQRVSSDAIYDKINHRDIEHEYLYNRNKIFDILFYCFYFSFLLIMICTQNIKRENFLIYLFVGLIPFVYPFVFKWILYLIRYLSNDIHGPKNAFVDINNTFIAYND